MPHDAELPIALDVMGGDLGVEPVVEGGLRAVVDDGARIVLVGPPALRAGVQRAHPALFADGRLAFVEAEDVVTMEDKPSQVVRRKKRASMRVACDLVASGRCGGVVSTGNSGAMLAIASFVFGRVDGVVRPAIATLLPALLPDARPDGRGLSLGRTLLLDAGANTVCDALQLAQWGVLGATYLARTHGPARPTVAVLSNGEEESKGTPLTREALALLQQTDVHVVGFCEGRDLNAGTVHVVVTDGFTGNIVLKTAEGVFSFIGRIIKSTFEHGSVVDQLGGWLSKPGWARIKHELDPREFGAAPLLGLNRAAFIAHGKSDAHAVRCGVRAVRRFVAVDVNTALREALRRNPLLLPKRPGAADDAA